MDITATAISAGATPSHPAASTASSSQSATPSPVQSASAPAGATDTVTLSAAARAALASQSAKGASPHAPASAAPAPNLTYKAPPAKAPPAHIHADIQTARRGGKPPATATPPQDHGKPPRDVASNGDMVSLAQRFMYNAWFNASGAGAVNSAQASSLSQPWKLPRAKVASSINAQITSFNLLPPHDQNMIAAARHETRLEFLAHLQSLLSQLEIRHEIAAEQNSAPSRPGPGPGPGMPGNGATPAQGSGGPQGS